MNPPSIRRPWERHRFYTQIIGESRTHQSHAEACDINNIIRRYDNTGHLPDGNGPGQFGDITEYQTGDTAGLILRSRETLKSADEAMTTAKKQKIKAEKDRIAAIEAENKSLKAAQQSATPSIPSEDA